MHVQVSCRKNYTKTTRTPSSGAEVFDRRTRTLSGGFNLTKAAFTVVVLLERKKRKLRNRVNVSCNNQDVDKAVH